MHHDRPLLGISLMLAFCVLAPLGDAIAKILGATLSIGMLVFVRFAVQSLLLVPLVVLTRRPWRMRGRILVLMILRTLLHIIGIAAMFTALKFLPLADAIAIAFVMPFIMLILGKYVLDEVVGLRRILACVVGFIGTLLVIQPSFAAVASARAKTLASCFSLGARTPMPRSGMPAFIAQRPVISPACVPALPVAVTIWSMRSPASLAWPKSS